MSNVIVPMQLTTGFVAGRKEHQGVWLVYLKFEGGNGYGIPWRLADELAAALRADIESPIVQDVITFAMRDRAYALPNMPTADGQSPLSQQLWAALVAKARECEEQEKAPQIAKDAALLHRVGFPVGITNDPKIKAEALKESQHSTELRRAHPIVGIRSNVVLGTPTIESKPPVTGGTDREDHPGN